MNTAALVLILCIMFLVIGMTSYFFFKIFTSPQKSEPGFYDVIDGESGNTI